MFVATYMYLSGFPQHWLIVIVIHFHFNFSSIDIAAFAKSVVLSHNNPNLASKLPANLEQRKGIQKVVGPHEVQLLDGSSINNIDCLLFCTGYHYTFPFLSKSCGIEVKNRIVSPLFKHMISINHPTLAFIGIPIQICPFPQVRRYLRRVWVIVLPFFHYFSLMYK